MRNDQYRSIEYHEKKQSVNLTKRLLKLYYYLIIKMQVMWEKKHKLNEYWHVQARCYYCQKTGHISKLCHKKASAQANSRQVIIFGLTGLLTDRFTYQASKLSNTQTGLANMVDALANKS